MGTDENQTESELMWEKPAMQGVLQHQSETDNLLMFTLQCTEGYGHPVLSKQFRGIIIAHW